MEGQLTACQTQMSFMDPTEPLWCERTQDVSGYVLQDTTLPLSDEQLPLGFSTAQHEYDTDVQNSEKRTPDEYILSDPLETVFCEDSNMFDSSNNYSLLDHKIKAWLPKISNIELDEFAKTNMMEQNGDYQVHINTNNSAILSETPKEEKKIPTNVIKKSSYFSIFECEEPVIKEDLESQSSCCTDSKLAFELNDEIEVGEEVVVTTENHDELESRTTYYVLDSHSHEDVAVNNEEDCSPLRDLSAMETAYELNFQLNENEQFLQNLNEQLPPVPMPNTPPKLRLDIAAALENPNQLLLGTLPDTPDVLKPVLNPESDGFDLVNFLLANNSDSNNNATSPADPEPPSPSKKRPQKRKGKSQLSLEDLKESQNQSCDVQTGSTAGTSSKRPTRKSATNFKKRMQDGLLHVTSSNHYSSDEEEYVPKAKHSKVILKTNSRKRLNSESDRSSICENEVKYRERRDRNNLSSKRSRQKRKEQQELKRMELKELEEKNKRLKRRSEELAATLQRVHSAWKEYLSEMNRGK